VSSIALRPANLDATLRECCCEALVFRNFQTIHYIDSINHESTNHAAFAAFFSSALFA